VPVRRTGAYRHKKPCVYPSELIVLDFNYKIVDRFSYSYPLRLFHDRAFLFWIQRSIPWH